MQARTQEQLRQAYLDAMGIQTWFPRVTLPNAGTARTFDWLEQETELGSDLQTNEQPSLPATPEAIAQAPSQPAVTGSPLGATQILDSMRPAEQAASTPIQLTPEPVKEQTKSPKATISQFRLMVLSSGNDNLVIAEMPYTGLTQLTRFHKRLLRDILKAVNMPIPNQPAKEFVWPMEAANRHLGLLGHINQDDNAAFDAVGAFLRNQFGFPHRKKVILLGQAAARFVIDPAQSFEKLRGIQQAADQPLFAVTYSLNELMKIPQLKSEAWQDLKPLTTDYS